MKLQTSEKAVFSNDDVILKGVVGCCELNADRTLHNYVKILNSVFRAYNYVSGHVNHRSVNILVRRGQWQSCIRTIELLTWRMHDFGADDCMLRPQRLTWY